MSHRVDEIQCGWLAGGDLDLRPLGLETERGGISTKQVDSEWPLEVDDLSLTRTLAGGLDGILVLGRLQLRIQYSDGIRTGEESRGGDLSSTRCASHVAGRFRPRFVAFSAAFSVTSQLFYRGRITPQTGGSVRLVRQFNTYMHHSFSLLGLGGFLEGHHHENDVGPLLPLQTA